MNKRLLTALLLCLALTNTQAAQEAEVFYWYMAPSGEASVGSDGRSGTNIDLEDDLGYGSEEGVFGGRITMGKRHKFGLSYMTMDAKASNTIERDVRFEDSVYRVSEKVKSQLDMQLLQAFYKFRIGSETLGGKVGNPRISGGLLAGGQLISIDAELSSDRRGSASESVETGMPFVGVFADLDPLPWLRLRAQYLYSDFDFGDVEATYTDMEISALIRLPRNAFIGVGIREITVEASDDSIPLEADIELSGPMAFAGFRW